VHEGGWQKKTVVTSVVFLPGQKKNRSIVRNERFQYSVFPLYFSTGSGEFSRKSVSQLRTSLSFQL
jgi:hypothetical protein